MSYDPWEAAQDAAEAEYQEHLLEELGPEWAEANGLVPPEDAIRDFTAERLQSYYVAHPNLAGPANDSLVYSQSLLPPFPDRKSTRLNSSHLGISYAVFC